MIGIVQGIVFEDSNAYALGRLKRKNASHNLVNVLQADFSSISRKVLLVSDGTTIIGPTTLTVSDVILDTLSLGTIWTKDTIGFNFINLIPVTAFPTGGVEVSVEYTFTLTTGEVWIQPYRCTVLPVLTS